jgi:hypothetical protein
LPDENVVWLTSFSKKVLGVDTTPIDTFLISGRDGPDVTYARGDQFENYEEHEWEYIEARESARQMQIFRQFKKDGIIRDSLEEWQMYAYIPRKSKMSKLKF